MATTHSPIYASENSGALQRDWPRIPPPATAELLAHSAGLGRRLAELLDAESSVSLAAEWSFLAALKLPLDPNLDEALKLTSGWGYKGQGSTVMPGRGLAPERPWTEAERDKLATLATTQSLCLEAGLSLLGESCVDVHLNGEAHWAAVPINVWNYTLGGYQVLKKWLSYREFSAEPTSPLLHRPLRPDEAAYFAQVVRLDRSHSAAGAGAGRQLPGNFAWRDRSIRLTLRLAFICWKFGRPDGALAVQSGRCPRSALRFSWAIFLPSLTGGWTRSQRVRHPAFGRVWDGAPGRINRTLTIAAPESLYHDRRSSRRDRAGKCDLAANR